MRGETVVEIFILHIRSHEACWFISPPHTLSTVSLSRLSAFASNGDSYPTSRTPHTDACSVGSGGNLCRPQEGEWFPPPRRAQNSSSLFSPLDFWSVPTFVDRFHWRAGIPWGHLHGEGGMEMHIRDEVCSLPLIYFRIDPKSISSVSNGGVDLGLFLCGVCFWRFGHLALTIRWFSQPSEAHAQRSVGGIVGWNPMWAILITFFLCCSLMRQRRGIIWTCFWGRFVSSA